MSTEITFAPFRSIDDFLFSKARFQMPSFKNLSRWNNRIMSNLLYYQTNYMVIIIFMFLLIGYANTRKLMIGLIVMSISIGAYIFTTKSLAKDINRTALKQARIKRQTSYNTMSVSDRLNQYQPYISLLVIILGGYLILHFISAVTFLIICLLIPIMLVIIHATLRLRNLKNKISNKIENVGLTKTPLGIIFNSFESTKITKEIKDDLDFDPLD